MKRIISLSLALLFLLTAVSCKKKDEPPVVSEVESEVVSENIVNPMVEYATIEDAQAALPSTVKVPTLLPEGYELSKVYIIDEYMLELQYVYGDDVLTYRTAHGDWDISGDYDFVYKEEEFEEVDDIHVFVRGEDDLIKTAVWWLDGYSYSLTGSPGVDFDDLKYIIRGVQ